ncbi:MAG: helix-hairpin-helix domain-containing protein [Fimbriiglobus sp.]|nr:helix-hairpin-helix domain-containing protein [Fimbriiglobus sp.]
MMTKMTGTLVRVLDDEVRLAVGPFEYAVMVSEATRRHLQLRSGQEVTLHLIEYFEGNQSGNRFTPRRIGFATETELDFFELFCTVEKIGVKKALKALSRGVRDIADAISRQDTKWLSTLPGIGATTAEQIVTTLKRKIAPFTYAAAEPDPPPPAELPKAAVHASGPRQRAGKSKDQRADAPRSPDAPEPDPLPSGQLIEDVYQALLSVGLMPVEARERLDKLLQSGTRFKSAGEAIGLIFGTKGE